MIVEVYKLDVKDSVKEGKSQSKIDLSLQKGKGKAMDKHRRKIYLVYDDKTAFYVGETDTSIKERMERSYNSYNYFKKNGHARGGYKGYKWLDIDNNKVRSLILYVVILGEDYDDPKRRREVEAIEGELVYEIRNRTEKWPAFQNEIHFSNVDTANQIAKDILQLCNF